ncbi:MAG: EAL domain-containing protein [Cyanobacteria bacterium P01_A01_bin.123]
MTEPALIKGNTSSAKVWGQFILAIATAQSELALCHAVADYLPQFIPADRVSVTRLISDGKAFEVFVVNGEKQVLAEGEQLPFDQVNLQAVIKTQRPHLTQIHPDSPYLDLAELAKQGIVMTISVPLNVLGQTIGSLNVAAKTMLLDHPDIIELIEQIATLLAMNLERQSLYDQTQFAMERYRSYTDQLRILNEIGCQLSAAVTKAEVFDTISQAISQVINVDRVSYAVPMDDVQGFQIFRFSGNNYIPTDIVIPAAGSGLEHTYQTGRPTFFDLSDQRYSEHRILASFGLKVGWSVPVRISNQIIGILNAASSRTDLDGQEQLDLLTTLGGLMGATLERIAVQDEAAMILKEIAYQARYDTLTNLPNRALFYQQLEDALAAGQSNDQQLAVLFIDLDRFKHINDTLGHTIGDKLLCAIAKQLQQIFPSSDTVARLGGDEFVVLLPQINHPQAVAQTAQTILTALETPLQVDGHSIFLGGSIGISLFPAHGTTPGTLMKHADIAMYHAKEQGRNNYQFYDAKLSTRLQRRIAIEHALRDAIANDELSLVFHPQICLTSGNIEGLEALVRWKNSALGSIHPDQFIPIAEESGLIEALSDWVLDQSLDTIKRLRRSHPELYVAVNFSAQEFSSVTSFLNRVITTLRKHQLPASALELEITESVFLQAEATTKQLMQALKAEGIRIAIDDFGTGFSSLSYLVNLPLDILKIDRSFIHRLGHDPRNDGIVRGTIEIAKSLGMACVAEGVETLEQLSQLQQLGCQCCQGFLFSKPVPASELDALLQQDLNPLMTTS